MLFSLPPGTEMFHFPGFPPTALYIQAGVTPHDGRRVPPFGHPRINALLATPLGLTRPDTSFIGSWYQGIHRAPLHTYTHTLVKARQQKPSNYIYSDARIHYPVLKHPTNPATPTEPPDPAHPPPRRGKARQRYDPRSRTRLKTQPVPRRSRGPRLPLQDPTVCRPRPRPPPARPSGHSRRGSRDWEVCGVPPVSIIRDRERAPQMSCTPTRRLLSPAGVKSSLERR
jgi:hypothetical protein